MTPRGRSDLLWMAVGAALLLALTLAVWRSYSAGQVNEKFRLQAGRRELVARLRSDLTAASEAEKSAVLSLTDEESQAFADRARTLNTDVARTRQDLASRLEAGGTQAEEAALAEFSRSLVDLQRIDEELLRLAVKNTNLKAYALTYGPAAEALNEMGAALARLAAEGEVPAGIAAPDQAQVERLASQARIASLQIATMLPPHVAEQSEERMTEMEARMTEGEVVVRASLDGLAALPSAAGSDLTAATSAWARFMDLKGRILALSRENTNVRSIDLSLKQKRAALAVCLDALDTLQQALEAAGGESAASGRWILP